MKAKEFINDDQLEESWSKKYKRSIDCNNPKGFSQKAHCAGRKARRAGKKTKSSSVRESVPTVNYGIGKNPGKLVPVGKDGKVPHAKLHVNVPRATAKKLGIPYDLKEDHETGTFLDLTPNFQNYDRLYVMVVGHKPNKNITFVKPIIADVKRGLKPNNTIQAALDDANGSFPLKSQFIKKAKVLPRETDEDTERQPIKVKLQGPSEASKKFVDKVNSMYPQSPLNPAYRVMIFGEGADMQIVQFELVAKPRDTVEIKWIQATPLRGGAGSKGMKILQDLAQQENIKLTLYAWDKGIVPQRKLIQFYKRHGFKQIGNSASMEWQPKS